MMRKHREPTRSVLVALVGLLVLGALAPHAWDWAAGSRMGWASTTDGPGRAGKRPALLPSAPELENAPLPPPLHGALALETPGEATVGDVVASDPGGGPSQAIAAQLTRTADKPASRPTLLTTTESEAFATNIPSALPGPNDRLPSSGSPAEVPSRPELPVLDEPAPVRKPSEPLPMPKPSEPAPAGPMTEPALAHGATSASLPDGPDALLEHLDELLWECETGPWAMEVRRASRRAMAGIKEGSDEAASVLDALGRLADKAPSLAGSLDDAFLASQVRRAEYALRRRLDVWQQAVRAGGPTAPAGKQAEPDRQRLSACLDKVAAATAGSPEGRAWQKYLGLDFLRSIAQRRGQLNEDQERMLARHILQRMNRVRMTDQQRAFLTSGPVVEFSEELRRWAIASVDGRQVLRHIECYERSGLPSDARLLADDCQRLSFSPAPDQRELGLRLESHYRNANLRVAVTADLLNRLTPARTPEYTAVQDQVLGRMVQGQSVNAAKVYVRLIPDPQRLRLALEVNGQVSSLTTSNAGPATFHNASQAYYTAWKELEVGTSGIRLQPAQVRVQNDIYLRDVNTNLDVIPLIGALAQNMARRQHEQSRYAASQEVAQKIEARAKQQIDAEVDARLTKFSERLEQRVIRPLDEMALDPTMITAETGERRMVARLRLGTPDQLGGHTPRPQAPSDSLASVQVHESAMNNILEQLRLNGTTMTVKQLRQRLAARFPVAIPVNASSENDQAEITFAKRDAVRVRCDEGRLVLAMAITALRRDPHEWRDFQVRIFYRPQIEGRSVELARDGVIHLMGDRLNTRAQIALRGIFGKTFSKQRTVLVSPQQMISDPRLTDLAITQFAMHDGWVGAALGPKRPVPAMVRRGGDAR